MEPIISVSGLRGVVGVSLTPEIAGRYVAAFVAGLGPGPIVIGRDGRTTGAMLVAAVSAALNAVGRDVSDIGIAATPTVGIAVREKQAAGGVQISASHNPPEYNGLKIFGPEGWVLTADRGEKVIARYRASGPEWSAYDKIGATTVWDDPHRPHLDKILANVDVEAIRARRFKVVLDANHGSGSILGRRLLEALNCDVLLLGSTPDGRFAHPPEPTTENLASVLPEIAKGRADVGFCQDPDADRLAVVDEQGVYIGEEYTLAICAAHVLTKRRGPVATNCSTSRMTEDVTARFGVECRRSPVGEAYVCQAMRDVGAVLGGEGNGGVIDPRIGYVRDSFISMALVLEALAERKVPLSTLVAELPRYAIAKHKATLSREKLATALSALEARFADAAVSRMDGLRFDWPGKWLLVRASNTEPIVRFTCEAPSEQEANELCLAAAEVLAKTTSAS